MAIYKTKLEAVNEMLTAIGRAPVNQISTSQNPEAAIAQTILDATRVEVLGEGWDFNTYTKVSVVPDGNGYINLPTKAISANVYEGYEQTSGLPTKMTVKAGKVFNVDDSTYDFSDFDEVLINYIEDMPWEEIPHQAQHYIVIRASRVLQKRLVNDPERDSKLYEEEILAQIKARGENIRNKRANVLTDNNSSLDIINRRRNPIRRY